PSVRAFHIPLPLKLTTATGDTTVVVNVTDTTAWLRLNFADNITDIVIDPDDHILNRTGTIQNDPSILSVYAATMPRPNIYPNPATDSWNIDGLLPGASLKLSDINGRMI